MLSQDHFYWGMFRKYIIAFSHIINDIHVLRTNGSGVTVKDITVPITYAQKSKLFYHLQRKSTSGRRIRTMLPRVSFVINGMEFDPSRKLSALNECELSTEGFNGTFQYSGSPWNFNIELSVWTVYMDDLLQIIEQIATFFKPDYSMTVKEIPELGVENDVPVELNGINLDIVNEFEEEDRMVRADATFTLKGWLYPPTSDSKLIKNMYIAMINRDTSTTLETIEVDWDEINQEIRTRIEEGQSYYDFASECDMAVAAESTGATGHNYVSAPAVSSNTESQLQT